MTSVIAKWQFRLWPCSWPLLMLAATALVLPSCAGDGHFTLLGYTSRPQYDPNISTVYVPIFKNLTFWKGLEFDLTRAVIREIEDKTPYKVVSDPSQADTELTGTIVSFNKSILNRNQLNETREAQTTLGVEVVWINRITGEVLSRPQRRPGELLPPPPALPPPMAPLAAVPGVPGAPMPPTSAPTPPDVPSPSGEPPPPQPPPPVLVQSIAGFIPELGESITTAQKQNVDRLAVQIVSMMEMPW